MIIRYAKPQYETNIEHVILLEAVKIYKKIIQFFNQSFFMQNLRSNFEKALALLIRPPRTKYATLTQGVRYKASGNKSTSGKIFGLSYSYKQPTKHHTTVIYLHSNSSSQLEGIYLESFLSPHEIALFLFDFQGCGNSDGEYITLGIKEAEQIFKLTEYIRQLNGDKIVLWGRSMGATSVIRYLEIYGSQNILCSIVDSPYKNLREVIHHFIKFLPNLLIDPLYSYACSENAKKIGYNLQNFQVESMIEEVTSPILFIASRKDEIVPFEHSKTLFEKIPHNQKKFIEVAQTHNQDRSNQSIVQCIEFIQASILHYQTNKEPVTNLPNKSKKMKFSKVVYRFEE